MNTRFSIYVFNSRIVRLSSGKCHLARDILSNRLYRPLVESSRPTFAKFQNISADNWKKWMRKHSGSVLSEAQHPISLLNLACGKQIWTVETIRGLPDDQLDIDFKTLEPQSIDCGPILFRMSLSVFYDIEGSSMKGVFSTYYKSRPDPGCEGEEAAPPIENLAWLKSNDIAASTELAVFSLILIVCKDKSDVRNTCYFTQFVNLKYFR